MFGTVAGNLQSALGSKLFHCSNYVPFPAYQPLHELHHPMLTLERNPSIILLWSDRFIADSGTTLLATKAVKTGHVIRRI